MDQDIPEIIDAIGPRLRDVRRRRGLTLETVAARSGLAVSTLSRLETGKRRPTLDMLLPLARVYEVSLDRIVNAPATGDPRVHLEPQAVTGGGVIVPLTREPSHVHVFKQVLGPRPPRLVSHEGQAWIYVLAGRLRLIVGGDEHLLAPGETAQFDAKTPHWFGAADDLSVEILHLFGPHGHRPVSRLVQHPIADASEPR